MLETWGFLSKGFRGLLNFGASYLKFTKKCLKIKKNTFLPSD
jgi:hypothetical protein